MEKVERKEDGELTGSVCSVCGEQERERYEFGRMKLEEFSREISGLATLNERI